MPVRRPGSATSTSDSQSSDAPSPYFSPLSNASGLRSHSEGGESPPSSRSARSTPSKPNVELSHSYSAGKGGCWTCRLRRKKCDEQRVGDSCRTCIRLNIDCLGWGVKRPEWMRDKQQVQNYRAKITDKLRRENRIRGQPRHACVQAQSAPNTPNGAQTTSAERARPRSFVATPTLTPSSVDWGTPESAAHQQATYVSPQGIATPVSGSSSPHIPGLPSLGVYQDATLNGLDLSSSFPFQSMSQRSISPISHPPDPLLNIPYNLYSLDFDSQLHSSALQLQLQTHPSLQSTEYPALRTIQQQQDPQSIPNQTAELVLYFFEHVKRLQLRLSTEINEITNIIYSIVVQDPRGPVANAICALASLHHTCVRHSSTFEAPDANPEHSLPKFLFDQAFFQLINSKHVHGRYTESDAIAALELTSFSLLADGWTDWLGTLQIAQEWLADTGILSDENPQLFIANMGSGGAYAAKLTIWLDIMSSVTLMAPPRFMDLYRHLFEDGNGGISSSLQLEQLTGYPDEVLYAIAQISALAHWKSTESMKGCLSTRELIRRGDAIEQTLRRGARESQSGNDPSLDIGLMVDLPQSLVGDPRIKGDSCFQTADIRRVVQSLFRESTVLYLHTVLSDPNPGVNEIAMGVDNIVQLLQQLPMSELDQAIVFPICLAGCMTDNQGQRQYLIGRLQGRVNFTNVSQARTSMEHVWQKRDMLRQMGAPAWKVIDWRDSLRDNGSRSLLV